MAIRLLDHSRFKIHGWIEFSYQRLLTAFDQLYTSILDNVILDNTNFKDNMTPYSDVNSFHLRKVDCSQSSIFSFFRSPSHYTEPPSLL